jgi:hypothetical protein
MIKGVDPIMLKVFRLADDKGFEWIAGESKEQVIEWYEREGGAKVEKIEEESLETLMNMEKMDGSGYEVRPLKALLDDILKECAEEALPIYIGFMLDEGLQL